MASADAFTGSAGKKDVFQGLAGCSDAALIKTLTGTVLCWNPAAELMFGHPADQAVGRHIGMLLPADLKAEETLLLERVARGETVEHYETRRLTRDGRLLDVDVSLWPIHERDGTIHAACSVMRDITRRKRADAKADELAVVVESAQDAILIKTLEGQITFWNGAAHRLYGYAPAEIVGRHIDLLIPPDLKDEEANLLERVGHGERIEHYETRRLAVGGRIVDIDVTLWPIRDRTGVITGICSTIRDITERKRAEKHLTELHAQQRHVALALHLMGASEQIPSARAATRYLPSTQGQGVGGDWLDLIDLGAARVGVVIGDVMGRGFEAAVVMGQLRSAARALALAGLSPCELMRTLDAFTRGLPEQFVTCAYLEADPARGEMTVCSAGHLPVLRIGPDATVARLAVPTGIPLGVGGVPHEQARLPLRAGTTLALCTDGLVETPHHDLDARLEHLATTLAAVFATAPELEDAADRTLAAMLPDEAPGHADDVSLLLVSFPTAPLAAAHIQLVGEAASVPAARRFLAEHLHRWHLAALEDTAVLLASELMTNAVRHALGPVRLEIWYSDRELGVEVTDRSTPRPCARLAGCDEESGRGLLLVEALADAWSTRPETNGKTVWFTLQLPAPAESARTAQEGFSP
ncbi:PAS domain S-box protein [Streptomyces rimosus]|uniref:PAS domain S-box protein n=1 Tax=Streptomyces rimosus TaxID=1927 RepID=UPI003787834D